MKGFKFLLAALLVAPVGAAIAMSSTDIPSKFNIPWANGAGSSYTRAIPQNSQIGIQNCAASLTDGFPPLTFVPQASGGCPPFGQDFNGIIKQITQWARWHAASGPTWYDPTFSAQIGGYPRGAILQSTILPGKLWYSTAENNATNPDDQTGAAANWTTLPGTAAPGALTASLSGTAPNTVPANGLTVGNASSNATNRANVDTYWLFGMIWNNCINAVCPIYTSSGSASTRGASAQADWNANKAIATWSSFGRGVIGVDGVTGRLTGVPIIAGSANASGSLLGENLHTLVTSEIPSHQHSVFLKDNGHTHGVNSPFFGGSSSANIAAPGGVDAPVSHVGITIQSANANLTIGSVNGVANDNQTAATGGSGQHNLVEQSITVQWNLAL
jgi:hypothetical protein